jgi:hypothetical protein
MARDWYYAQGGRQRGPVSEQLVRQLAASGQLQPDDLVWYDGLKDWIAAASVPGLIPAERLSLPAAVPPMAGPSSGTSPALTAGPLSSTIPTGSSPEQVSRAAASSPPPALDIPPLVALMLAVCTFGLFTIWYTWRISAQQAKAAPATDRLGRPLGRVRHPAWILTMSYVTLGVYFGYWVYRAMRECSLYTGRTSQPRGELTLILICPPYAVYSVVFKLPELIREVRDAAGLSGTSSEPLYCFLNPLMFLGLPFLAVAYQEKLNEAWGAGK